MIHRIGIAAALSVLLTLVWQPASAETKSAANGTITAELSLISETVQINGSGCGVPASKTLTLPADVFDVRVREPAIGASNVYARLTDAPVQGNVVTFTAVGHGEISCGAEAPTDLPWSLDFGPAGGKLDIAFKQRVTVAVYDDVRRTVKIRPRIIKISIAGSARGIRWKRYGGSKAVGYGVFKSLMPCAGGCTDNGTPLKLVLTRPSYCPGFTRSSLEQGKVVFYGKVAFVLRKRLGVLKPGTEWMSSRPRCPGGGKPVRTP